MTELRAQVHAELKQLDEQDQLTAANVVDRARDSTNVLHKLFTWDNNIAGEKYRLQEARTLIRYHQIKVIVHHQEFSLCEFVERPLKQGKEQGYVSVQKLVSSKDRALAFMQEQLTLARTLVSKTIGYAEVLGLTEEVAEAIENLDATLGAVRSRLPNASTGTSEQPAA